MKTLFAKKSVSFTYIFVQFCFNSNKQKYIDSTQIQKKAISKFKKKRNNNIYYEKKLNFISTNSSLQFITIYLYYIYVINCFLGFFLILSDIRLGIKSLFRQKLFLKRSKKSSRLVVCQPSSYKHCLLFRFSAKKFLRSLFFRCVFRYAAK